MRYPTNYNFFKENTARCNCHGNQLLNVRNFLMNVQHRKVYWNIDNTHTVSFLTTNAILTGSSSWRCHTVTGWRRWHSRAAREQHQWWHDDPRHQRQRRRAEECSHVIALDDMLWEIRKLPETRQDVSKVDGFTQWHCVQTCTGYHCG